MRFPLEYIVHVHCTCTIGWACRPSATYMYMYMYMYATYAVPLYYYSKQVRKYSVSFFYEVALTCMCTCIYF